MEWKERLVTNTLYSRIAVVPLGISNQPTNQPTNQPPRHGEHRDAPLASSNDRGAGDTSVAG